jgi:hypothetical protein
MTGTYLKSGLYPFNPHCEAELEYSNQHAQKTYRQDDHAVYEPAAKPNKLVLALKEKQHYQKVSLFH